MSFRKRTQTVFCFDNEVHIVDVKRGVYVDLYIHSRVVRRIEQVFLFGYDARPSKRYRCFTLPLHSTSKHMEFQLPSECIKYRSATVCILRACQIFPMELWALRFIFEADVS